MKSRAARHPQQRAHARADHSCGTRHRGGGGGGGGGLRRWLREAVRVAACARGRMAQARWHRLWHDGHRAPDALRTHGNTRGGEAQLSCKRTACCEGRESESCTRRMSRRGKYHWRQQCERQLHGEWRSVKPGRLALTHAPGSAQRRRRPGRTREG
eukprot:2992912-Prymnesium_polylepis.2